MHGERRFFQTDQPAGRNRQSEPAGEGSGKRSDGKQEELNFRTWICETLLTDALICGVPYDIYWKLNPAKLKPFYNAYKEKLREQDVMAYYAGIYNMRAFSVVLDAAFRGHKATSKYFDKPIHFNDEEENVNNSVNPENNEELAVYEMKVRCKMLEKSGLPPSPK